MKGILWIAVLTALNWVTVSQGTPINRGPPTNVFSASEVVNSGVLIEAYHAGGTTPGRDLTVNGATSYTFEGVVATGGNLLINWGDITSNYGADHWSTVTAVSVRPSLER